jgi:hypothetical protein
MTSNMAFRDALDALDRMKAEGVVEEYYERSDQPRAVRDRARSSTDLVAKLRAGKSELRRDRERLPLREKVRLVIELQRVVYPLLARRRALEAWERPWDVEP